MPRFRFVHVLVGILLVGTFVPAFAEAPAATDASQDLVRVADEVAKEVEALRGWTFKGPVQKRFCTPDHVRRYLVRLIDEQCPAERVGQIQAFLRTVGLLPRECDLKKTLLGLLEEQVGGYYDTEAKALYLVTRGERLPALVERVMIAHELTHALDDQHAGLDGFLKSLAGQSEDLDLVTMSVIEGSATALMTQYMARAQLSGRFDMTELQQYAIQEAERSRTFLAAPRYFSSILGTYMCGMQFLAKGNILAVMMTTDNRAVGQNFLAAVKDPPRSTEQILHPAKYWDPATRDDPVVVDDAAAARLLEGPGRWVVHRNTAGEMLCAMLTAPEGQQTDRLAMSMADAWTNPAAAGWGGDRFYLIASGPDAKAAGKSLDAARGVWFTLWDTPEDRDEFVQAYEGRPMAGRAIVPLGSLGAVVLFGFDAAEQKALAERLTKSPPPMTRAGKPCSPWAL